MGDVPRGSESDALAAMRVSYGDRTLDESGLAPDPLAQFHAWFADAVAAGLPEPNAMTVATATLDGDVSARTVLCKDVGPRGFAFYSNLGSRKGRDLEDNPRASLVFAWLPLHRQVVVVGEAEPVTRGEVAAYFGSRPHGHQIGAAASDQSRVIASRAVLEQRVAELRDRYPEGTPVPLPDVWGGYVVHPVTVEFWQGRESRLHDRLRYRRVDPDRVPAMDDPSGWVVERLSP